MLELIKKVGQVPKVDLSALVNTNQYTKEDAILCIDLVVKMLKWVSWERISARDAMDHPFLRDTAL